MTRCRCRSIYCKLDWVTGCQIPWICEAHDRHIRGV